MCDTMMALGNSTKDGSVIFAKNSDRQPNEPHIIVRVPAKKYPKGENLKCTYIEIEQAEETYEVLLLKPSWIWGCEMGANEFGLNIGNEAVFTKEKLGKDSLTGMDMARIALERCKTSEDALNMIVDLLDKYGQGGNCGYEKNFSYHNSFLIADKTSGWVLETAGKFWVAEKVTDIRAISNCLTIGSKFDRCHPDLIKHAVDNGWCKSEKDFNFAKCYENPFITRFSGAHERLNLSSTVLNREKGNITVDTMKRILRCHEEKIEGKQFEHASIKSVCMHAGGIIGDHTTGSYIASLSDKLCTYYVTGASTPCLSAFKPLWFISGEHLTFGENEIEKAVEYWKKREMLHRYLIEGKIYNLKLYMDIRNELENEIADMIKKIDLYNPDENLLLKIMEYASSKEDHIIDETLKVQNNNIKIKGSFYFKHFWKKTNRRLLNK